MRSRSSAVCCGCTRLLALPPRDARLTAPSNPEDDDVGVQEAHGDGEDLPEISAGLTHGCYRFGVAGATFQKNPFTIASLTDGAAISSPEDMIGKKIGVQDSTRSVFDAFLAVNDIAASEVEIVPVQYDPAPLVTGEVDGLIAFVTTELFDLTLLDEVYAEQPALVSYQR